jgi:hypothetical protein
MTIPGKRVKLKKWIHGDRFVVQVEVEGVLPEADPSEPCLEPQTIRWLDELQRLADTGDEDSIRRVTGSHPLYTRRSA